MRDIVADLLSLAAVAAFSTVFLIWAGYLAQKV